MANITFVVGNGLDLSFGLKTSYSNFYSYAKTNKLHPANRIYNAIKKDTKTWADFELALGQYTHYIEKLPLADRGAESNNFHKDLDEIRDDLADYLETQRNPMTNIADSIKFNRDDFIEGLSMGHRNTLRQYLSNATRTDIRFLTLNYTDTLEIILKVLRSAVSTRSFWVSTIGHIHGTLQENMTLGVSEESQLFDGMSKREKEDLIKPSLILSMNDGRLENMHSVLNSSNIIVIFGSSIGSTDKYIWEYIVRCLSKNPDLYIVMHSHNLNYTDRTRRNSRQCKIFDTQVKDRLLRHSDLDEETKLKLESRIFVVHNTKKLFATH